MGNSQSTSLLSIQALRAVAALLVLAGHISTILIAEHKAASFPLFALGPFGVDLFFVISGFVMVYSSERLFGQPGAPFKFFARRLARIVPLYWAATSILVWFVVPYASTKAVLGSFLFAPHIPSEAPLLFVGWTLIFEMFFYAVFAIALLAKRRLAVVAGASLFLISFVFLGPSPNVESAGFFAPPASRSFAYLSDPIIIEFAFGMGIALVYRAGVRLPIPVTLISIVAAMVWYAVTVPSVPRQYSCGLAAALIVAGTSLSSMPRPKPGPILASVVFLGDASYALYLTHTLSFAFLGWIAAELAFNPLEHLWPYAGAMFAMSLMIAAVTHLIFERPITGLLQRRINDWRPLDAKSPTTTYPAVLPGRR
jgi:exopolysaccharide production protein ExoZ